MDFLGLIIHFMVLMVSFGSCSSYINGVSPQLNDDVLGLIVFKLDLHDPSSYLSTWNEDDDSPCSWEFVRCNPVNGRVSEISLDGLGLSGTIGIGLEKLQHLKVLSLSNNKLSGTFSRQLLFPASIEKLDLSYNNLSGQIGSSFVNMSSIRFLDLSNNLFSGPLADSLFQNCLMLHHLSLAKNKLEGPIPRSLSSCLSLNSLNLSNNYFSGYPDFSPGIWSLRRLRTLDLSRNSLSGTVPKGISAIHNLKELLLHSNQFSGPLPSDLGLCPHLAKLDLSDNKFTGALPESLYLLKYLVSINLSNNMLMGDFPLWIGTWSSLEYMDFSSNGFTGSLPLIIGDLRSITHLSLSNNRLSGAIPESLIYCTKLSVIQLNGNNFNGSIPEALFELGLEEIDLSQNTLTGSSIPLDLLKNNNLIRYLNLSWNNLESRIPKELGFFQSLTVLDLRNSALYGSIPRDICDSVSLQVLQLDGNSLSGPIPDEIGNCSSLNLLSLSRNNLSGSIPKSISKLNKLKVLKLELNQFSGEIPQELGRMENLLAVNISYNRLTGRLPVGGIFQSLDESSLQGNLGICSPLLKGPCKMNVPKPLVLDPNAYGPQTDDRKKSPSSGRRNFLSVSSIVAISAATLIATGVVVITMLNISARKRLALILDNPLESIIHSSPSRSGSAATGKLVLFDSKSSANLVSNPESLLNKAAEIGGGVFGSTVYKVSLGGQEGTTLAIKKLVSSNTIESPEDFDREVRILGKAKHPNLISLKGYYWSPQMQLLLMEYASNGSLQAILHERLPSSPSLSWANRFRIMLGTANGLAYLHHSFNPPIIHYSLKPSNILLDENFNAKISDFSHERLMNKHDRNVISSNRLQSGIGMGYVAPELTCRSLRVNEKCDVYCFGVMILELVTGRRPVEYGEDNVVILKDHVRVLLEQGNVMGCVDPSMSEFPDDEILPVIKLALVCTSQIPSSRPSMADVVQILQVIQTPVSHRMSYGSNSL